MMYNVACITKEGVKKKSTRYQEHDQNNQKLKDKIKEISEKLKRKIPTIPSTIKDEMECNIFLKSKNLETFSKLRDLKDNF